MRLFRKRNHPIKGDETGRSARRCAFDLFGEGQRPSQVCRTIGIPPRTAYRYYEDYKKLNNKLPYSQIRKWMKESPEFSEKVVDLIAASLGMSREEVVTRMQKPWGLLQAMKGEWPDYRLDGQRAEIEDRLLAALEVVNFANQFGQKDPQKVRDVLRQLVIDDSGEERETKHNS